MRERDLARWTASLRRHLSRAARSGRSPLAGGDRTGGGLRTGSERRSSASGAAEASRREPSREGRLLVWRDRYGDAEWESGEGADLFGREGSPSRAREAEGRRCGDAGRLVFVDIETCGLSDRPIFLVGTLVLEDDRWLLEQRLAPDPSAEPELLGATARLLARRPLWLSFNGRSFDIPRVRRRSRLHGVVWPEAEEHRDLLRDVRRRWKGELPDCRLSTVERRLLGLARSPRDVPGREIPERYHDFVRSGERRWIDPVIEHNRRDVAALGALLLRLDGCGEEGPSERG